ncbi:MAG TPA: MBL fold metallo-hydrolase [Gammaproteobacteria bacterium]|nr:MBL fold metallo-hydrolase [Gammaproteobacteria bacterium]
MSTRLDYPAPALEFGETHELVPGVRWLRLPLPFPPRHVNVYLLDGDGDKPFLVDTGYAEEQTTALWNTRYSCPDNAVVTHFHPDHIGQAAHLERAGARIHGPRAELEKAKMLHDLSGEAVDASLESFFTKNGMDCHSSMFGRGNGYRRSVPDLPEAAVLLEVGPPDFARAWEVSFASGHSPAHALLFRGEEPVLAAGDVLLPEITPNISVWPDDPDADPLGDYFEALGGLRGLPEETLVLPAHGLPYRGLHARIDELVEHHEERLQELRDLLAKRDCTAMEALPTLFPQELKRASIPFAFGETLAHLNRLWHDGDAERITGGNNRYYYRLTADGRNR